MSELEFLTAEQYDAHVLAIAKAFNGVPICQIDPICRAARQLILECHKVDIENPRFTAKIDMLAKSGVSSD